MRYFSIDFIVYPKVTRSNGNIRDFLLRNNLYDVMKLESIRRGTLKLQITSKVLYIVTMILPKVGKRPVNYRRGCNDYRR